MEIHVKLPSGKVIALDMERHDMIEDVRQMIQEKEGISPHQQRLFLRWRQELKNGRTLSDYHIKSKTTVRLAVMMRNGMLIFIKVLSMTGGIVPLGVEPTDTVLNLKEKIHAQEGILPDTQQLFFGSNRLENERTLSHYDIVNQASIGLLLPMASVSTTGGISGFGQYPDRQDHRLVVRLTDTVMSVKEKIQAKEGIPPDLQRLIISGILMNDEQVLWAYGLLKDNTIHLGSTLSGD